MSRTQGYHVKLTPQGSSHAEERTNDERTTSWTATSRNCS